MKNLKKCPICGEEKLIYTQNADISFKVINGKLEPMLKMHDINWLDHTALQCIHCYANDYYDKELDKLKKEYDLME